MPGDYPRVLHVGSGKSFIDEYLNLDIDDSWRPDIVADLGEPFFADGVREFDTKRFGSIRIQAGSFDEIIASDVLEHIPDLVTAMTNCKDLLKEGGIFKILVPYDLSTGAWSDPTHVRAFNERSWVYYTEWSWYFGWDDFRFQQQKLEFRPSDYGKSLQEQGQSIEELLRSPRAIDAMYTELVKVPLSAEDRENLRFFEERPLASDPAPGPRLEAQPGGLRLL